MAGSSTQLRVHPEYRLLSRFIGDLLRKGFIDNATAQRMLVEGYWDVERKAAKAEGIDLDAQVASTLY